MRVTKDVCHMSTHKKVVAVVLKVDISKSRSVHILMGKQYALSDEEIYKLNIFINNKYSDSQLKEAKENDFNSGWYFMLDLSRLLVDMLGREVFQIASVNDKLLYEYDECNKQLHTTLPELQNITEYPYFGFFVPTPPVRCRLSWGEQLSPDIEDAILVKHHSGKMGIFTKEWGVIFPCKYDNIGRHWDWSCDEYVFRVDNHIVSDLTPDSERAKLLLQYDWVEKINSTNNYNYLVTKNNLVGICDNVGDIIIPIIYDKIELLNNGMVYQFAQNSHFGLYDDSEGRHSVQTIMSNKKLTGRILFIVGKNGRYGVIDEFGKWQIPCEYIGFQSCNSSSCIVAALSDRDYILYRGDRRISRAYQEIREFNDGVAIINMGGSWRTYNNRRYFKGGKYGLINENGKVVLLCDMFSDMFFIGDGLYVAMFYNIKNEKRYQIINKDGMLVSKIAIDCDEVKYCGLPNHFFVVKDKKYGLYNYLSAEIIKCEFDEFGVFELGARGDEWVARVCLKNRYRYINNKGEFKSFNWYNRLPYSYGQHLMESEYDDYLEDQKEMEQAARFYMSEGSRDTGGMDWDTLMDYLGY